MGIGHGLRPRRGRGVAPLEYSCLVLLVAALGFLAFNGVGAGLAAYFSATASMI